MQAAGSMLGSFGSTSINGAHTIDLDGTMTALRQVLGAESPAEASQACDPVGAPVELVQSAQEMFNQIDTDGCGYIDQEELECLLLKLGRVFKK